MSGENNNNNNIVKSNDDFAEFEQTLGSFHDLKSGISGSRIKKLTNFALNNISLEEEIVSSIIKYSKTCQDSHKLGSLYIIDSIGRAYLDEARSQNEQLNNSAPKGTCAHAIFILGESIEELLTVAFSKSSDDNKDKIKTLIDIWDRTGLFKKGTLNAVRAKCLSLDETSLQRSGNSNGNSNIRRETIPEGPRDKALYILNNLKPLQLDNLDKIQVSDALTSSESFEQQNALRKLLISLQNNLIPPQSSEPTQVAHRVTEYGSRRERERQTESYSSRRNRSRSPPASYKRREHEHATYSHNNNKNSYHHNKINQHVTPNNHHLYPDEMNIPQNPHYRPARVSYDPSMPPDHVKVLSRTLFIGGVPNNMKEWDLANLLRSFAEVQSVILNNHRKHAFVKVYSRTEAENVLINFNKDGALPLRTRWGVGFGPRDCCDYQHGFSMIPIRRLTDADKKWSVEAQWGGTHGQPLTSGIVYEEPDIIVGEGITSKSMSQKMPTDSSRSGPKSNKDFRVNYPPPQSQQQQPPLNSYGSPNQMYGQMQGPDPSRGYPPPPQHQNDMYGPPMGGSYGAPPQPAFQQQQPQQLPSQHVPLQTESQQSIQGQQGVDPQAQLNSLMSMLNQQQQPR